MKPIILMRDIVKKFPGIIANDHINLKIFPNEVLALLGENGAGKTTLMNILYGLYQPDEGIIIINGKSVRFRSPKDALMNGIGMVHQQFTLIDNMTVIENVILGLKRYGFFPSFKKAEKDLLRLSKEIGFRIKTNAYIWQLSAGERQRVEILKALFRKVKVLILDEPSSVLTPKEVKELFNTIRKLVNKGIAVVFISHKLREVMEIADRIVVLRRGKVVGRLNKKDATPKFLAKLMVGREVLFNIEKPPIKTGKKILEVEHLTIMGDMGIIAVKDISFKIHECEILGVAGVAGNGQKELIEALYGLRKPLRGRILLNGKDITKEGVGHRIIKGVALVPEERLRYGVALRFPVSDNLVLERIDQKPFAIKVSWISPWLRIKALNFENIRKFAKNVIKKYNIVPSNPSLLASKLSGGNLQKVIVARELERKAKLILAEEPTAGLDVAATEFVRNLLVDARAQGKAVLLVSSDLSEVLSLSDKVIVMYEGEIVGAFRPGELGIEEIGLMMAGAKRMPYDKVKEFWV